MDIYFGVIAKLDCFGGSFLIMHHRVFSEDQGAKWEYIFLGGAKISNIFQGMPDIPEFFLVNSRCWVQAYVARNVAPPPFTSIGG